jgi:GDPmannose 4,6-dehydratase
MEDHVVVDERFLRPAEVDVLLGDPAKAKDRLGWVAETTLEQLVVEMVEVDLARIRKHETL